ncbi:hypothetical protein [Yoonia sediminilitoris]|uniref:Uncharacterized protein n=1 Tax=Yoonia sediminilitoris TaxID=1286148 RepID=A0A2T6KQF4_9RHOB|nr:hypothetical protein [Yoonia sediminilitoris]PUB18786.1 hypothetical protein C8N45_101373 [Yoonia sediminilitoris]RCW98954.1 hypothetical protein DFP92_101373 [Yoonia sediminilitoris]
MPRLTLRSMATLTIVSFALPANAYSTEPAYAVTDAKVTATHTVTLTGVCVPRLPQTLAALLALPPADGQKTAPVLACASG